MLTLTTPELELSVAEDGSVVRILDRRRDCAWQLDTARAGYRLEDDEALRPLPTGRADKEGDAIVIRYGTDAGAFSYRYTTAGDHVQVSLECESAEIETVSLTGPIVPTEGARRMAVPLYQGVLLDGGGPEWEMVIRHGGHLSFSMAMAAVLGTRGGMMVCHESPTNWSAALGRYADGPAFQFLHGRDPVDGWVGGTVRLYPVDADVVSACKCYRRRVKERGDFLSWEEKIARKPILRDLFGATMAFVGYNACPDLDYAEGARRMREMGFESVFYYPVRMFQYSLGFLMGGDKPIWLSDEQVAAVKAVDGAHVSPWAWVVEGLDDGSEAMHRIFRKDANGEAVANWKIDEQRWYLVCTPYQVRHVRERLNGDMSAMDWLHFDVNAVWSGRPCFDAGHDLHGGHPMGRKGDMESTRHLFSPETVGNRIVSSEGFNDYYAGWYDIGSTKIMPPETWDPGCVPIPMTMLVFHDCCVHDWWELHNYNDHPGFGLAAAPHGLGTTGCGLPELKAAMDSLYACPPNVFPFGKQYGWVDAALGETYSYRVNLNDDSVQAALRAALPVARLHKEIGMLEMVDFEFVSDDRAVQATTFSDGTRIVANLSERDAEAPDIGLLPAHSWQRT